MASGRADRRARGRAAMAAMTLAAASLGALPGASGEEPAAGGNLFGYAMEHTRLGGSVRGAYWSTSRDLEDRHDLGAVGLWLEASSQLAPAAAVFLQGWVRNDDLPRAEATSGQLREAYIDLALGRLDVRLGKQIIVWGRADGVNPTDNLTSRDFTLLVPEDTDQRTGSTGIRASYRLAGLSLTGVWLATFEPDVIPIQRPSPPFSLRTRQPADPVSQWAFKLDHTGGRADWSLSYYDGYDLKPDLVIDDAGPAGVQLALRHHRIRVIGADVAAPWGPYAVRAEAAFTFTEHAGASSQVKSPFFALVVGGDRTWPGALTVNVQYILRVVAEYRSPVDVPDPLGRAVATERALINNQLDQVQSSVLLRVGKKWLNDTLEAETTAILSLARFDYAVRPKVRYAITDRLRATVGADVFRGARRSFFGRIRDTSTAYAEIRWDF